MQGVPLCAGSPTVCRESHSSASGQLLPIEDLISTGFAPLLEVNGEEFLAPTMLVPGCDWLGCTFPFFLVPWEKRD